MFLQPTREIRGNLVIWLLWLRKMLGTAAFPIDSLTESSHALVLSRVHESSSGWDILRGLDGCTRRERREVTGRPMIGPLCWMNR